MGVEFAIDPQLQVTVLLNGTAVGDKLRSEACSAAASKVSQFQGVRSALLQRQRDFLQEPGLVADGRDMGTVIFPQAPLKIFLTASCQERANRRFKQLKEKGIVATLEQILADLNERDRRDRERKACPLRPADDAVVIDTTALSISEVFAKVLQEARKRQLVGAG